MVHMLSASSPSNESLPDPALMNSICEIENATEFAPSPIKPLDRFADRLVVTDDRSSRSCPNASPTVSVPNVAVN